MTKSHFGKVVLFSSHVSLFRSSVLFESHVFQYKRHQFVQFRRKLMSGHLNDSEIFV